MSHRKPLLTGLLTWLLSALVVAQGITIPNTFVNGTAADADQVNANFTSFANDALNRTGGTMTGTLNTLLVRPTLDDTAGNDLGDATHRYKNLWLTGTTQFNNLTYTWPGTQTATYFLQTNGSGALTWAPTQLPDTGVVEGRLTLTSGTAVTTSDVTNATNVYWTPYRGHYIALYDGVSTWSVLAFNELTLAVPGASTKIYDVFIYNNAGTPAIEGLAWTNDTTRATALTLQDGVWVKSGATTRRYVGSYRTTTVAGETEDSLTKRFVYNLYNRLPRLLKVTDTTDSWVYNTATFRQARAQPTNQVEVVLGIAEVPLELHVWEFLLTGNSLLLGVGIGEDSTTVPTISGGLGGLSGGGGTGLGAEAWLKKVPAIGYHYYAWLERGDGSTTTFYGDDGTTYGQSGLMGTSLQ